MRGTAPITEPPAADYDLLSRGGAPLVPEASMGIDGSQKQMPNEANEVTLLIKSILRDVWISTL